MLRAIFEHAAQNALMQNTKHSTKLMAGIDGSDGGFGCTEMKTRKKNTRMKSHSISLLDGTTA